jgi:hypothetical protein
MLGRVLDAHHTIDFLYTAFGWLSNIALFVYAPFARSWRRALLVQLLLVGGWAAFQWTGTLRFGEDAAASLYLLVLAETLMFAVVTRTLKLLLFRLPALKALEARLRSRRGEPAA